MSLKTLQYDHYRMTNYCFIHYTACTCITWLETFCLESNITMKVPEYLKTAGIEQKQYLIDPIHVMNFTNTWLYIQSILKFQLSCVNFKILNKSFWNLQEN